MKDAEEWLPIEGHERLYEVSSLGRVRSLSRIVCSHRKGVPFQAVRPAKFLRPNVGKDGWPRVTLYSASGRKAQNISIARLVWQSFVGAHTALEAIEFLDGDRGNCALENITSSDRSMPEEEWRPVCGWDDLYEVSDHGRVRSKPRLVIRKNGTSAHKALIGARIMKLGAAAGSLPYPVVSLRSEGRRTKTALVHRLVCTAFHGPPPPGQPEVCHNDGDPTNGRASNLRWGSRQENVNDAIIHGFARLAGIKIEDALATIRAHR